MSCELVDMIAIQNEREKEINPDELKEMDAEEKVLAENKRFSFDFPVNAVTVDPLR